MSAWGNLLWKNSYGFHGTKHKFSTIRRRSTIEFLKTPNMRSRLSNHSKNINILRFGSTSKNENIAFVARPSVCLAVHLGVVFKFCKTLPFKRIWHTWERPYFPFHLVVGPCFAPPPHHKVDFWRSSCPRARSLSDAECQVWHYFPTRTTTDINRRKNNNKPTNTISGLFLLPQHPYRHSRRTLQ